MWQVKIHVLTRGQGATSNFSLTSFQKLNPFREHSSLGKCCSGELSRCLLFFSHLTMFVFYSLFNNVTEKKLCEKNKVLIVYSFIHSFSMTLAVALSVFTHTNHGGLPQCLFSWSCGSYLMFWNWLPIVLVWAKHKEFLRSLHFAYLIWQFFLAVLVMATHLSAQFSHPYECIHFIFGFQRRAKS